MELHKKQVEAIEAALNPFYDSVFITGQGGTGKSEIIKQLVKRLNPTEYVLLAPTQSAALKIGGKTIHSFFKIRPTINIHVDKEENVVSFCLDGIETEAVDGKIVIVDEASMLGESMLKGILERITPKKLILFGDPQQLDPIKDKPIDWSKFCDVTVTLTKNYRVQDEKLDQIIAHYRDTGKLLKHVDRVSDLKHLKYDDKTIYIAHTNEALSEMQKHLLGYAHAKTGDIVLTFGGCDETIKRRTMSGGRSIVTNYFNNNDLVRITSVPRMIDDKLWSCDVERVDGESIYLNEYNKVPSVIVGDYSIYKKTLEKRFKTAQRLQKEMSKKYKVDKMPILKKKMTMQEAEDLRMKWIQYFQLKNSPYARHHQFRTTYKAQGQSFEKIVIDWYDLPGKDHKYVALSRAMNNLILILD